MFSSFLILEKRMFEGVCFLNFPFDIRYNLSHHETLITIILSIKAKYFFAFKCKWFKVFELLSQLPRHQSRNAHTHTWDVFRKGTA